jgi:hypothetical protein
MSEVIPLFPLSSPLFPGIVLPLEIFEDRYRRLVTDLLALPSGSPRRSFGIVAIRQGWEVERVAPAEALYDVGCLARVRGVRAKPDGGFRVVTVGADRFRLRDVLVGSEEDGDPPYLRAEVEWLTGEEAAEEAAAGRDGLVEPSGASLGRPVDEVAAAVARGSLDLLVGGVRDLFSRYVAEVAALRLGWDRGDPDEPGPDGPAPGRAEDPADDDADRVGARTTELLAGVADDPAALSWLVASASLLTTEDRQALLAISATRRRLAAESRLLRRELTLLKTLGAVPVPLREFATPMTVN